MTCSLFHPGLLLILSGLLISFLHGTKRTVFVLLIPCLALASVWNMPFGSACSVQYLDYELTLIKLDALSRLFITVFSITVFTGSLFCCKQAKSKELAAAFIYAGGAMSVVLAGDLISLFVFWELMALASTLVIWSAQTTNSQRAGMRYIVIHLLGGVILMCGITAHVNATGSILFTAMQADSIATWLILCGFLLNAGAPPLTAWLADAYPEASFSGTVFLSAFTTKTAVYVLLRGFPGTELLVYIGLFMIFYGIIYALLENDMRRILAYSIINQVGFMLCGIGIGTEMALNGAAAHAFTHIIYKALLLMSAGSVLYMTGKRKCTDLGGLVQSMPVTTVCGIIGALAISSFPLTSGFVSKSMVTQASVDEHLLWIWLLLQAASAGVFLHAGIKFPWFVFFQKDSGLRPDDPPLNMQMGMIFFAVICVLLGVFPNMLYFMLPYDVNYEPYTAAHVVTQLQLLLFSGLAFFVMLPLMKRTLTLSLDFDWFYRKLVPVISNQLFHYLVQFEKVFKQGFSDLKLSHYLDNKLNIQLSVGMGMSMIMVVFVISLSYLLL
ncbi:MAG TPA: Na(+)/H(+) antiporter subunit D [Thiotrichaceae bacterium]|nr:Na(+)/H(+) antiporter subunit D [Thiotrichaceae bacterium]HIM07835.1 Na(+)/H(+) antiporter subunit D [Gammaproteobacteria bacterium]